MIRVCNFTGRGLQMCLGLARRHHDTTCAVAAWMVFFWWNASKADALLEHHLEVEHEVVPGVAD